MDLLFKKIFFQKFAVKSVCQGILLRLKTFCSQGVWCPYLVFCESAWPTWLMFCSFMRIYWVTSIRAGHWKILERLASTAPQPHLTMLGCWSGLGQSSLQLFFIQVPTLVVVYETKNILHLTGRHLSEAWCLEEFLGFKGIWIWKTENRLFWWSLVCILSLDQSDVNLGC